MRILLTGASGLVGAYVLRALRRAGLPAVAWSGSRSGPPLIPVDLADRDAVAAAFRAARPDAVIHAAAVASLAGCDADPEAARRVNVGATQTLVELTGDAGASLVLLSTDLVFGGERAPYREDDEPAPLSLYGRTKADAERAVLAAPHGAALRLSLLYGPHLGGGRSFFDEQVAAVRGRRPCPLFEDEWRTPLDLISAGRAVVDLTLAGVRGVLHVGGPERLCRRDMGRRLAAALGGDPATFVPAARPASRPRDVSLDSSRWRRTAAARGFDEGLAALLSAAGTAGA